jgi:hypothetical protein
MEQGPDELDQEGVDREEQLTAETDRPLDEPKPAGDATTPDHRDDQEGDGARS